jgi:hypothetical protein
MRRAVAALAAGAVGLAAGAALGLVGQPRPSATATRPTHRAPIVAAPPPASLPALRPVVADTLLAWTPVALPPRFTTRLSHLPGVNHVVAVMSGEAWLTRSSDAAGHEVDHPPRGFAIPVETAAADPQRYLPFVRPADRPLIDALVSGQALLGQSSAAFRHLGPGGVLWFGSVRLAVAGVIPDSELGAHELLVSVSTGRRLGLARQRYVLVDPSSGASRTRLTAAIRAVLPSGVQVRVRGPGETPYFREGDAVLPQIEMKEAFGEFTATPLPNGYLDVDPAWRRSHIVTANVPILGTVTCNRVLLPMLRGALSELRSEGLGHLVHPGQYGGCYAPRFVDENPQTGISHHAWGAAVDLNVADNVFGSVPHMDPRVVDVFERWGFTWGGRWMVPDGMHFEFLRFPTGI